MRKQVLPKISKKQKHQYESLIRVLKPKVYITDSSNFKRLVQELTGSMGNSSACFPPTMDSRVVPLENVYDALPLYEYPYQYQTSSSRSSVEVAVPLVSNKSFPFDHYQNHGYPNTCTYRSSSVEVSNSMDAYPDSTVSSYNTNSTIDQEYSFSSQQHREDVDTALEEYCPMSNKLENLFTYREIESFLLENP